jgi:lysophospholipase L1-like esterase
MRLLPALLALAALLLASSGCGPGGNPDAIRVACVGDSITYGMNVRDREENCYPRVLGELLGDKYAVRNFGVVGATVLKKGNKPYWKQSMLGDAAAFEPHIVIIQLGTNDTKPRNWRSKEDFTADLRALIDHFSDLPSKPRILLCKPVPVVRDLGGINRKTLMEEVIPGVESVANEKGLPLIDLHAALQGRPVLFPDGVHPNAAGARIIARTVHAALVDSAEGN